MRASTNPRAAPLEAESLEGVAPATVITAEFDVLRDEGAAYARRLSEAGVAVTHHHFPGTCHGFVTTQAQLPREKAGWDAGVRALVAALHPQ